jgi:hypothetical protein
VSLQVKAARGVQCGEFTVEYDPGTLQLLGVEAGDLFGGKAIRVTEHRDEENGVLTLVLARGDSAPAQSSGAAARLSFKARGADAGISLASAKLSDATYRELTGVTLSGYRAAAGGGVDATGDGAVDYRDAAAVTSAYGSSRGQQAYAAAADLNGDGRVGLLELALVASVGRSVEAAAGTVAVSVKAPSAIKEGEEFTATIEARWSATAPAGFEAAVRVDPRGFKILGVEKGDAFGSSPLVGALKYSASEGTAFAALAGAPTEVGGALLKLRLLPLSRPGSFTVSVEKASFCDASGNPIEATLGTPGLITLQSVSLPAVRAAKGFQPPEEGPLALVGGVGAVGVLGAATLLVKRASVPAPVLEPALELEAPMRPVPRRRRVKPKVGVEGAPLPVPRIED